MEKYYSFTTYHKEDRDKLRKYLHENNIYYELSSYYDGWHFEIKIKKDMVKKVAEFIINM